jgi:polysaccharide deacetylase 2 family uncharacterized protein YibQ
MKPKGIPQWPVYSVAAWVLGGLALLSMLALDRMNWRKGEKSYIFTGALVHKAPKVQIKPVPEIVKEKQAEPPAEAVRKPEPKPAPPAKEPVKVRPAAAVPRSKVAIVMDDMGNSMEALDELLALGERVTVSVLPYSPHSRETAETAHRNGLEVLLHLPLESLNNQDSEAGTEGLIHSGMSEAEVRKTMADDLDRVPYIKGVNNHMGSKVTADEALMRIILEPLKEKGLFFLDSRTSARSVAYSVARDMGIPAEYRQVFLDADGSNGLIKERLLELFRLAQKEGRAIGICHPFRETLQTLKENFHLLKDYGLEAVFASELATLRD